MQISIPRRAASAPVPPGGLHVPGRVDHSLMTVAERDAHQSQYRAFLLAVLGPVVWTYVQRSGQRALYLRMRTASGNPEALRTFSPGCLDLGSQTPASLRSLIASPGLPPLAAPSGKLRVSPTPLPAEQLFGRVRERLRHLETGTGFRQVLLVETFPEFLDDLSLERLWHHREDLIFTMRLQPVASREAQRIVERRLLGLQATTLLRRQRGGVPDAEVEQAREDALSLRASLVEGRERLFMATLLASVEGQTREQCEAAAARLRELFAESGFGLHVLLGGQLEGARWLLPEFAPKEPPGRLLSATALSCLTLLPAAPPPAQGRRLGIHLRDRTPVVRPRETMPNPVELVLGAPGFGKSAYAKTELLRARPERLLVVDPEGEYGRLVAALGGTETVPGRDLRSALGSGPPIALDLRELPRGQLPGALLEVSRAAIRASQDGESRTPIWLTLDEAHLWLTDPAACQTLLDLTKRSRKRGLVLTLVSQNVGDFLQSEPGQLILANAGRVLLFRQQATDTARLSEVLRLSERAADFVRRAPPGEALLIDDQGPTPIRVDLSEEELHLVDTRPRFARSP